MDYSSDTEFDNFIAGLGNICWDYTKEDTALYSAMVDHEYVVNFRSNTYNTGKIGRNDFLEQWNKVSSYRKKQIRQLIVGNSIEEHRSAIARFIYFYLFDKNCKNKISIKNYDYYITIYKNNNSYALSYYLKR
jgi:hypothetical protein